MKPNSETDPGEMDDYDDYDDFLEAATKANGILLNQFNDYLIHVEKIPSKQASKHQSNLEFFGNAYLAGYSSVGLVRGYDEIGAFLGNWFIRKAMWADVKAIKNYIVSFQLFYNFFYWSKRIDQNEYDHLLELIEEGRDRWIARMKRYDDPSFEGDWYSGESDEDDPETLIVDENMSARDSLIYEVNLLLSGKVLKFLGLKPTEIEHTSSFGNDEGKWFQNWRCEELCGIKKTKAKIFLITNLRTCYSFLIEAEPKKPGDFVNEIMKAIVQSFKRYHCQIPPEVKVKVSFFRGLSRQITGYQNMLRDIAYFQLEKAQEKGRYSLRDLDAALNGVPSEVAPEFFGDKSFEKMVKDEPPFQMTQEL